MDRDHSRRESQGSGAPKLWWRTWTLRSASRNGWQCALEGSRCSAAFGDRSIPRRKQVRLADRRQCAILRLDQDDGLSQFVVMSCLVNSGHRGVIRLALLLPRQHGAKGDFDELLRKRQSRHTYQVAGALRSGSAVGLLRTLPAAANAASTSRTYSVSSTTLSSVAPKRAKSLAALA